MKVNCIIIVLSIITFSAFAQVPSGGGGAVAISATDLPNEIGFISTMDKLIDHALEQVEDGGKAVGSYWSTGINYSKSPKTYVPIPVNGRTIKAVLVELSQTKFAFPVFDDPGATKLNVNARLESADGRTLFSGEQYGIRLVSEDGGHRWLVPANAQRVKLYLQYEVELALPMRVSSAEIFAHDENGDLRSKSLQIRNGRPVWKRDYTGQAAIVRLGYQDASGTFREKYFAVSSGIVAADTQITASGVVATLEDDVFESSDDGLTSGKGFDVAIIVPSSREFSPLVRLYLREGRTVRFAAAVLDADGAINELTRKIEVKSGRQDMNPLVFGNPDTQGIFTFSLPPGTHSVYLHWKKNFQNKFRINLFPREPVGEKS